jgi:A/G-specific adenine glycosylase
MAASSFDPAAARRLRAPILRWYRRKKRDLPWRRTADPYAIWVSEAMLQQTTVAAVIPYWERFVERFPDAASLAASREEDVLALWSGLGYYRRARALRQGALAVMERHGGRLPDDPEALMALPGIGRYTAGAIASVAFGREAPVVDGNVKRVFSRLFAMRGDGASATRAYWSIAGSLVKGAAPGDWNQALMELGATVCTPRAPRCASCPVADRCRARRSGRIAAFPARAPSKPTRLVPVAMIWIERRGRILLERRVPTGPLRGAWDLPAVVVEGDDPGRAIARALSKRHGLRVRPGRILLRAKHAILRTRLAIDVVEAAPAASVPNGSALRWIAIDRLGEAAISGATAKIARAIDAQRRSHDLLMSGSSGSRGRLKAYDSPSIRGTAANATSNPAQ